MTCEEFQHFLDNYESLTDTEKLMMTAHASECESCRKELDFMLSIISVTKNLPEIDVPDDFLDKLNARVDLEEIRERQLQRRLRRSIRTEWKRYGSAAACLLLVAVIGVNGKTLVSQMTEQGNGVITEERVTSDDNRGKQGDAEITALPGTENVPENAEVSPVSASAEKPSEPAIQSTAVPVRKSISENSGVNLPVQTVRPVNPAVTVPTVTQKPSETSAVNENSESEYKSSGFELATEPPATEENTASPEPYTLAKERYRIPIESVPYGDGTETAAAEAVSEDKEEVNGYSLAGGKAELALGMYTPIDKDGNPTDYVVSTVEVDGVPSGSSILVSSADEEKVRSLINRYITGNYGLYYMITEDKLNMMFEELDKAGINYEKFIRNSSEKVSFKLVVIS